MGMCKKCTGCSAWMFLIVGILFLLKDFGVWSFWGISGFTALFVLVGLMMWGKGKCADCQMPAKGRK